MNTCFYDELAPYYHLLYGDWEASIVEQGDSLASLLGIRDVQPGDHVLDAACGIGTQALGLIRHGFRVTASDLSPGAVERLRLELDARGLNALTGVGDLRTLAHVASGSMAAVLACDNSLPHLLSDEEILQALRSCHRCLRAGGVVLLSVRDYARIKRRSPDVRPYGLRRDGDRRFLAVQVWEWDGDQYDVRMYLTSEAADGRCETRVLRSRYYAVTVARLMVLLGEAGFSSIERRDDVLFQPVLIARRG